MKNQKNLEDTYQKKTLVEHILLRPDTYIGSTLHSEEMMWIKREECDHFELRKIQFVPGLYKIFDEIIVNAADNFQRDATTNRIEISINRKTNEISVYNNGEGVPVVVHKKYNMYIPELIFGELLSGSNFNDDDKKVTGGRNGYGAKLTNIFSKKFTMETADSKTCKKLKKVWTNNLSKHSEAEIVDWEKESFTRVTFTPDLSRFGMKSIDEDTYALFCKRVYDLAGVVNEKLKVYLNGKKINVKGFKGYVDMYLKSLEKRKKKDEEGLEILYHKQDRWEVALAVIDDQFTQVSFVNSICTSKGGTHVNAIMDQVVSAIQEEVKRKSKGIDIKPAFIKNTFWVFVNSLIENPAFDSQTKETLTSRPANFGSKCELPDKFIKQLMKSSAIDKIVQNAQMKENAKMAKTLQGKKKTKLFGIAKLEDANLAGTKDSHKCVLILTEGDSAKSLAMAGIEVVGRDYYGVFPLRGKLLNVREAAQSQIMNNEEIQNLIEILGLQVGKTYDDISSLRYGSIMIMADQDVDGSHIKGLIINFISFFWPSLLQLNGFVKQFITPIIKVSKTTNSLSFYTINDYKKWAAANDIKGWRIKYYKGLGTSTNREAKDYFAAIAKHKIDFVYKDNDDEAHIDLLFSRKKADLRKDWLITYNENDVLDHNVSKIRYKDFINKELIHFSVYDNMRSIPSVIDGLKPSQRKILYGCFKKNLTSEMKVAQLSGYIAEHSAYHHGEVSLQMTIVGLAQNFVGSNNINLLEPIGQFGTRALGGKDAASARYIHTCLSKITRYIFDKNDDEVLTYINDDGQFVEPTFYVPIIPMILVNGAEGIGTGWSTFIPCYSPREIAHNLQKKLEGKSFKPMNPFYKGFTGEIIKEGKSFLVKGKYRARVNEDILEITDLPIAKWTRAYKSFLETLAVEQDTEIEDFKEFHTTNAVRFEVKLRPGALKELIKNDEVEKRFKLNSIMSNSNFVLFNKDGKLKRYEDELEIMEEFYETRLAFYSKRKEYLISKLNREIAIAGNKERFISWIIEDKLKMRNARKSEIVSQLIDNGFLMMKDMPRIKSFMEENKLLSVDAVNESSQDSSEEDLDAKFKEYGYLLSLPMWSMSFEEVQRLKKEVESKREALEKLKSYSEINMWKDDLQAFLDKLDEVERNEEAINGKETLKSHSGSKIRNGGSVITDSLSKSIQRQPVKPVEVPVVEEVQLRKRPQIKQSSPTPKRNERDLSSNKKSSPHKRDPVEKTTFSEMEIEDLKSKDFLKLSLAERIALLRSQNTPNKAQDGSEKKVVSIERPKEPKQTTLTFKQTPSVHNPTSNASNKDISSESDLKRLKTELKNKMPDSQSKTDSVLQSQTKLAVQQTHQADSRPPESDATEVVPQRKKVFMMDDEDEF